MDLLTQEEFRLAMTKLVETRLCCEDVNRLLKIPLTWRAKNNGD
jgi:hypothetical protein